MKTNSAIFLLKGFLFIILVLYISPANILAQDPIISIPHDEGFIFELDPNNPQTSVMFTIFNNGQNFVSLDLKVESADSTYILYQDEPDISTYNGNIWRMRPDGSEKTQLTYDTLDNDAVWSPDGSKIAFMSYRSGNADIWVMNSDGTNLINLTNHPAADFGCHFSPDGQYIIFTSQRDDLNSEVYRMTSSGANVERLTFNSIRDGRARYSPNGQYFATQSRIPGEEIDIYIYTSDGQSYVNIGAPFIINDYQPSWTVDGKRVVWASGEEANGSLNIVSANKDGSDFKVEFTTSENDYYPRYSPDGQFLAFPKSTFYSVGGDEIFVWHKPLDTLIQITDNTLITREWGPEWSPFFGSPNWPSVNPSTTQIPPGDSISINININAAGLTFARHTASVMIYNEANDVLLAVIPINLFYVQQATSQSSVSVNVGWNILSVPLVASDMTATTLFPTAISPFYAYSSGYNQVTTLQNGTAYWAKFDGSQSITITGNYVTGNEISVNQGWNLIGPFAYNVLVSSITTIPPAILSSPFYGYEGGYIVPTTLLYGKGYWIKANQNGVIQLNARLEK